MPARQFGGQGFRLRLRQNVLAPVEDQRQLAEIGARAQRPCDCLPAGFRVAGYFVVQSLGEARLRHGSFAGHQQVELVPAHGLAIPLAAQQLQPPCAQKDARMRAVRAQGFGALLLAQSDGGRYRGEHSHRQRERGNAAKGHSPRLCHSDTPPAQRATL